MPTETDPAVNPNPEDNDLLSLLLSEDDGNDADSPEDDGDPDQFEDDDEGN